MERELKKIEGGRTPAQLRNHYEVEKAIAQRLKVATREERKAIYASMYDELFARVPDHPRLQIRADDQVTSSQNRSKLRLLAGLLRPTATVAEFAPGDCRFAYEVARQTGRVYGLSIGDERGEGEAPPPNFELIVYDGYHLPLADESIDVVFSDQLIEHFHPDEVEDHFRLARRILRPGGSYVFRTPHHLSGPWDISRYFSDEAEGFHLKEWTYTEMEQLLRQTGFRRWTGLMEVPKRILRLPFRWFSVEERLLSMLPRPAQRRLAGYLLPSVAAIATR